MAYTKTAWKDRQVEKPRTFRTVTNSDGTITLTPAEGTVIQSGTPILAATMNNIENGIANMDGYIAELDENPYFRLHGNSLAQNYGSTNAKQQITFASTAVTHSRGITASANSIRIDQDGVYRIKADMQLSGLNANVIASLFINVAIPGQTAFDLWKSVRGASGWDGANGGGVWISHEDLYPFPVGTILTFYAQVGESPRTITSLLASAFKISKNTVAVN